MVDQEFKPAEQSVDASGVRSVRRALDIMSLFAAEHPVVTLKEVVATTGLPRTTAIRLIDTLEDCGLMWPVGTNEYVVGPALLRWNGMAAEAWQLPLSAREAMENLARETRETATLFVRQGVNRICVGQVQGSQALRQVTQVGREHPMWAGAPAKVLLVNAGDDEVEAIALASPKGAEGVGELRAWRRKAATDGYAVSHGEREDGLSVVSVPIRSGAGDTVAALAVAGPRARFGDPAVERFLAALRAAGAEMHGMPLAAFVGHMDAVASN